MLVLQESVKELQQNTLAISTAVQQNTNNKWTMIYLFRVYCFYLFLMNFMKTILVNCNNIMFNVEFMIYVIL